MINVTTGDAVTLVFPIIVNGEYATPDANSVTYTLRDNSGNIVTGQQNVALTVATTDALVTIASQYNSKSLQIEFRTVILSFTVTGAPYKLQQSYRINDWLNITASNDEVRKLFAFSLTELPDSDIDFFEAYYTVSNTLGGTILSDALASGTNRAKYANDALTYQVAFDLIPSLQARYLRKESSGTSSYERFSKIDFEALHDSITSLLEQALLNLTGNAPTYPPPLVGGSRVDPLKGPLGDLLMPAVLIPHA